MFVTLREDVLTLGKKDERVQVSDAYARNILIPKNLAFVGKQSEFRIQKGGVKQELDFSKMQELLKEEIVFKEKANEEGGLYKKISEKNLLARVIHITHLKEKVLSFDKSFEVIDSIGEHSRELHIQTKKFTLSINVQSS